MSMLVLSPHAETRMTQRGMRPSDLDFILHGRGKRGFAHFGSAASTMSEPTRRRIDMDGLLQMLLSIGRALGTAMVMVFLLGPLLVGVATLILGLFVDLGDEWVMPLIVGWAGLAVVALLLYFDWRSGNL